MNTVARRRTFRKGVRDGLSLQRPWPLAIAVASVLAVAIRLVYINLPLSADEGGFAEVARLWRNGSTLYDGAWADRPQGLLLVFRGVLSIHDSELALRAAAIIVSVALLVVFAGLARRLVGRRAALIAVFLLATAGASPFIEAYTLSGELLASAFSVGSLFAFVVYLERRHAALILLAGLLTGSAVMVKQSGFDAGVAALAYLLWTERRAALRPVLMLLAGALVAPVLCAVSAPDFGAWWHAVVAYRFEGDSLFRGGVGYRLMLFFNGLRSAALALAVPLVLLPGGWRIAPKLLKLWFVASLIGVLGGGNFWAHYWIQIAPPLCLIAALRLAELLRQRELRRPLRVAPVLAAVVVSVAVSTVPLAGGTERRVEAFTPGDTVRLYDEEIAAYVRTHTSPNDRILVTPLAGGSIYFLADRLPAYRFLWYRPAMATPGAVEELQRVVAERRASLVVVLADPSVLDPSGRTTALLKRGYRVVRRVGPTAILAPA